MSIEDDLRAEIAYVERQAKEDMKVCAKCGHVRGEHGRYGNRWSPRSTYTCHCGCWPFAEKITYDANK